MNKQIEFIKPIPYYTPEALAKLCYISENKGQKELREWLNSLKLDSETVHKMRTTINDKLLKSYEILAGHTCNTDTVRKQLTKLIGYSGEMIVNTENNGVDALWVGKNEQGEIERTKIEFKSTNGRVKFVKGRCNREKNTLCYTVSQSGTWKFHTTASKDSDAERKRLIMDHKNGLHAITYVIATSNDCSDLKISDMFFVYGDKMAFILENTKGDRNTISITASSFYGKYAPLVHNLIKKDYN